MGPWGIRLSLCVSSDTIAFYITACKPVYQTDWFPLYWYLQIHVKTWNRPESVPFINLELLLIHLLSAY